MFLNLLDVLSLLSLSFLISMNFSNLQLTTLTLLSPIFHPTPTSQSSIKQQDIFMFLFLSLLFPFFILLPLHRVQWNNTIYLCFCFSLLFFLISSYSHFTEFNETTRYIYVSVSLSSFSSFQSINKIHLCFCFTLFFLLLFILLSFRKAYKTISKNLHYLIVLFIDQTIRNLST